MKHYLNKYYKDLQEIAERHYREDLEAWQYKDEITERALASSSHDSFTHSKQYNSPCEKQPISEAVRKLQEDEQRSAEAESALYENYRANEDANEFEVHQQH